MTSIIEYWREISLAAGGIVSFIVGRKSARFLEKKQQADAVSTMQNMYDTFLTQYKEQYKILQDQVNKLQSAFLELQLSYAKEIEVSQNWEKLHRELERQYRDLEKKHNDLERQHEKLKTDFEKYKKINNK